mgnify:CR=1 FL=1
MRKIFALLAVFPSAVLADAPPAQPDPLPVAAHLHVPCEQGCLNPIEAVTYASYLGSRAGVAGEFELTVKAVGFENGRFFLNSELDYRDRNCLTLVVPQAVMQLVAGSSDVSEVRAKLVGKRIVAQGIARQVRIDFIQDNKPKGKYYYQVHLLIGQRQQMIVMPV